MKKIKWSGWLAIIWFCSIVVVVFFNELIAGILFAGLLVFFVIISIFGKPNHTYSKDELKEINLGKPIKQNAVVMYEREIAEAKRGLESGKFRVRGTYATILYERIWLSQFPSDGDPVNKKKGYKEEIWTNRRATGQAADYEIRGNTLILYLRFYPPELKNTVVYRILEDKIQRLGNLELGKKIAKKGTLLDPARPGKSDNIYIKKLDNFQFLESNFIEQAKGRQSGSFEAQGESELSWTMEQWQKAVGKKLLVKESLSGDDDLGVVYKLVRPVMFRDSIMLIMKTNAGKEVLFESRFQDECYYEITEIDGVKLDGWLSLSDKLGDDWLLEVKAVQ